MTAPNAATDALRTLHRIHRQLTDLNGRLDRGPKQISATESHVEHRGQLLADVQGEARTLRMAADSKQVQLKGGETKIEDLKAKLNTASSNREYQALKDQIAALKMTNSVLDDEILEAWEKIEQFQEKVAEAESVLADAREKGEKVAREVQQQEPLIRGDIARLEAELQQCETNIPPDVRDPYMRLVRQRGEDGLAAVENENCSGCHTRVPLNVIAEIMMGRPMLCRSCGRMLYLTEDGTSHMQV